MIKNEMKPKNKFEGVVNKPIQEAQHTINISTNKFIFLRSGSNYMD